MWNYLKDRESRSIGALFIINAIVYSTWTVRIPDIKRSLQISDAELGLALLAPPLGIILFTPITTIAMNRLGTGKVAISGSFLMCLAIIVLGLPQSYFQVILALLFFGTVNGMVDISMNGVASAIEKNRSRVIMSTTHGFWSLGAMVSSFLAGYIASFGVPYHTHFIWAAILTCFLSILVSPALWSQRDIAEQKLKLIWPGNTLVILIIIVFLVFMVEGGIADWTALFYQEILNSSPKYFGFGFGAFSAAMAIGRFGGDSVLRRYAPRKILIISLFLASAGILLFAQGYSILVSTLAMAFTGFACAVLVPLVFREAGASKVIAPSLGLALVSSIGYAGFLVGPPVIGFVAEGYGLSYSFVFLSIMMFVGAILAFRIK